MRDNQSAGTFVRESQILLKIAHPKMELNIVFGKIPKLVLHLDLLILPILQILAPKLTLINQPIHRIPLIPIFPQILPNPIINSISLISHRKSIT
jgi:hypothetical protein